MTHAPQPISRTYISQRLKLHFVDWGNPTAPPLLLVHGGQDHARSWDWVARRLAPHWHVIAPDLRGHGDSQWADGSTYMTASYIYDLAQLIHQMKLAPVTIVAHSLGGTVATRYAGLFPENVARICSIEGLGWQHGPRSKKPAIERMQEWVEASRKLAGYQHRRYATLDEAIDRMAGANKNLSRDQATHLAINGVAQNEDGTFSWKFDPYVKPWSPYDITREDLESIWARITCPTLLMWGSKSFLTNPETDGRAKCFPNARVEVFDGAGHWIHHDQLDRFMAVLEAFLNEA